LLFHGCLHGLIHDRLQSVGLVLHHSREMCLQLLQHLLRLLHRLSQLFVTRGCLIGAHCRLQHRLFRFDSVDFNLDLVQILTKLDFELAFDLHQQLLLLLSLFSCHLSRGELRFLLRLGRWFEVCSEVYARVVTLVVLLNVLLVYENFGALVTLEHICLLL
jgi:hypothetical protein